MTWTDEQIEAAAVMLWARDSADDFGPQDWIDLPDDTKGWYRDQVRAVERAAAAVSAGPEPAKRFSEDDLQGLRDDLYSEVGQATGYISDHDDDTVDWKTQFTDTLMLHFERFLRDFAGAGPEPECQWAVYDMRRDDLITFRLEETARQMVEINPSRYYLRRSTNGVTWEKVPGGV